MLCIYAAVAVIRMANWVQNDTYRAAGDAAYGTLLEIVFMFAVVLPAVICWVLGEASRRLGWIKPGDLKLD